MDTRPDTAGFISQQIDALHNDLERDGRRAIEALQRGVDTSPGAGPLAATLTHARDAVNELLQLFEHGAAIAESSLDANVLLSRDMLYVTDVDINTSFNPVSHRRDPIARSPPEHRLARRHDTWRVRRPTRTA